MAHRERRTEQDACAPLRPEHARQLTTIDLFAGAGGLSEGFRQAGFKCLYANEIDRFAAATFGDNHPRTEVETAPVEEVLAGDVRTRLGLQKGELTVLTGGPPCQGFSINAPGRFLSDPRNSLFRHYVRFLEEFQPRVFVFENVPGLLSLGGGAIFERIVGEFARCGYAVAAKILFAAHYGVPQERWRLFILGARGAPPPLFPQPSHYAVRRANFRGGRTMVYRLEPDAARILEPYVSVAAALDDLPALEMGEGGEIVEYDRPAHSEYARTLRNGGVQTYNHFAARLSEKNQARLRYIKPGGSWRDIPHELLPEGMKRARKSDHTRRYGRLHPDGLAGTIMTKCDPHWGPVFLPCQDRALTVREAARLQSFPDWYRFCGSRVSQYEQVGNAVPVLLARAVAESIAAGVAMPREAVQLHGR